MDDDDDDDGGKQYPQQPFKTDDVSLIHDLVLCAVFLSFDITSSTAIIA